MQESKNFYGGFFISREQLQEAGIPYPIQLEYYKVTQSDNLGESPTTYGVQVVKKEYEQGRINIESKIKNNITSDEIYANQLIDILHKNQVTPMGLEDVIEDLSKNII